MFQNGLNLSQQIFTDLHFFFNPVTILMGLCLNSNIAFLGHSAYLKGESCLHPKNRAHTLAAGICSQTNQYSHKFYCHGVDQGVSGAMAKSSGIEKRD